MPNDPETRRTMPLLRPPADPRRTATPDTFEEPADAVFAATIDAIRALPAWEVVTAHFESGEIHTLRRGRLGGRHHRVHIVPQEDGTLVNVEALDRRDSARTPRAHHVRELLESLSGRVDQPRVRRPAP